jgi:predicted RND superfamily exporter protein
MWEKTARIILRNRLAFLLGIICLTVFMGFNARKVQIAYDMQKMVPADDVDFEEYVKFKTEFGEDGNKLVAGFQSEKIETPEVYNEIAKITKTLEAVDGVQDVVSLSNIKNIVLNEDTYLFEVEDLRDSALTTQEEIDEFFDELKKLRFYKGIVYNHESKVSLIVISIDQLKLDSASRNELIENTVGKLDEFGKRNGFEMHYSGLPFVRYTMSTKVAKELVKFTFIALGVMTVLLLVFFRSFTNFAISFMVVVFGVVWALGWIGLFEYKVSLLTGLIPPLIVVIGIPNCIYLINKYHDEYRRHKNKVKALSRIISKVGVAALLTNTTTAIGFGVFYYTKTLILEQFGIITFLSLMSIFVLSILIIPIALSYIKVPTIKQTKHLENKGLAKVMDWLYAQVTEKRRRVYYFAVFMLVFSAVGLYRLKPLVFMVDDIPKNDKLYTDLMFFEEHFNGIMPFEIIIDTGEEDGVKDWRFLLKVYKLQKKLAKYEEFSKPLSVVEIVSYANQAYNEYNPSRYRIPNKGDLLDIIDCIPTEKSNHLDLLSSVVSEDYSRARISLQMADVGSERTEKIKKEIATAIEEIFPKDDFDYQITGTTNIFLKGNKYLVRSLIQSLLIAFVIIAFIMASLFTSFKMVMVSLIPNMIPLVITSGIMGHFGIPLKPSTILVFSVAFGIAVDDTIHFLAKFRQELKTPRVSMRRAVTISLKETGISMIYTSVVLFFGFIIFGFSDFQGTVALGLLTSLTLFVALFSNLLLLPSLLLSYEKRLNAREELKESVLRLPDSSEE